MNQKAKENATVTHYEEVSLLKELLARTKKHKTELEGLLERAIKLTAPVPEPDDEEEEEETSEKPICQWCGERH